MGEGIIKSTTSVWISLVPADFAGWLNDRNDLLQRRTLLLLASFSAISVRALVAVAFIFYFAILLFFGVTYEQLSLFFISNRSSISVEIGAVGFLAFLVDVVFWNAVQGAIDLSVSWLIRLTFIIRYGKLG